jgi:hypothetical protein
MTDDQRCAAIEAEPDEDRRNAADRAASGDLRTAVTRFGRSATHTMWMFGALVIAFGVVVAIIIASQADITQRTAGIARANRANQAEAATQARIVIRQTCERQNDMRRALRTIIERGDRNLASFYRDGTISKPQYRRAVRASRQARADLHAADCTRLAQRIPEVPTR